MPLQKPVSPDDPLNPATRRGVLVAVIATHLAAAALVWPAQATLDMPVWQRLVAVVFSFFLVPDASVPGSDQFPAPAAPTWRVVALAPGRGLEALEPVKVWLMGVGGAFMCD